MTRLVNRITPAAICRALSASNLMVGTKKFVPMPEFCTYFAAIAETNDPTQTGTDVGLVSVELFLRNSLTKMNVSALKWHERPFVKHHEHENLIWFPAAQAAIGDPPDQLTRAGWPEDRRVFYDLRAFMDDQTPIWFWHHDFVEAIEFKHAWDDKYEDRVRDGCREVWSYAKTEAEDEGLDEAEAEERANEAEQACVTEAYNEWKNDFDVAAEDTLATANLSFGAVWEHLSPKLQRQLRRQHPYHGKELPDVLYGIWPRTDMGYFPAVWDLTNAVRDTPMAELMYAHMTPRQYVENNLRSLMNNIDDGDFVKRFERRRDRR